jgi:flagellar biosynthesis protein FlhB
MHLNFGFSAVQILWTLTFAALLVLLVVLLGRDRVRRFPWFTASMALMALRMVASRLLFGKMAPIVSNEIFLALAVVAALVALLVVVEMARRAFSSASRTAWITATLVLVAVGGVVLAAWGPWPSAKTLFAGSTLGVLRLMQLIAQKAETLADLLVIQLGILVVLFGRRFHAGWRSHVQQIVIGLSTAAMAQLAVRGIWQVIALHTTIHSRADYVRVMALEEKLFNADSVVFLAALVWWIVCLWIDEPGSKAAGAPAETAPAVAEQLLPDADEEESQAEPLPSDAK